MKLFTKYSRINVLATVVIFLIACTAFYFTLHFVLVNQIDQDLKIEEREIESYVQEHHQLPETIPVKDQMIFYKPVSENISRHFATSFVNENGDQEKEKYRQLIFSVKAGEQWYAATVSKSLEQTENLTQSILLITFITILTILFVSFLINRIVLKKIWKPFYQSLDAVKKFKVGKNQSLQLPSSSIEEFQIMNATLEKITDQAQLDYLSLKTFSENASHEIQTPLAVIRSKLDLLIQEENLNERQTHAMQAAYTSIQKLTKLNHSLLLLAKIENNQFDERQVVDLKKKLEEKINEFKELWQEEHIAVSYQLQSATITVNEDLADVLLNNLLNNATKHNYIHGEIEISLSNHYLEIVNTSRLSSLDENRLYLRFTKPSNGGENTGLGLSIVKQICEVSGFTVSYAYKNLKHSFKITWKN